MSFSSRAANFMPMLLLRSPAHSLLSRRYAIIEFTGKKSGRTFRTPIAYIRDGSQVLLSTDSPWRRNLRKHPGVRLRLRGREVQGHARVVSGGTETVDVLRELVEGVRGYSRPAGVRMTRGRVSDEELARAVTGGGRRCIIVDLDAPK